jgi:hypothetical protein
MGVPAAFKRHALAKHSERFDYMTFDIHHFTYALSPKYHNVNDQSTA